MKKLLLITILSIYSTFAFANTNLQRLALMDAASHKSVSCVEMLSVPLLKMTVGTLENGKMFRILFAKETVGWRRGWFPAQSGGELSVGMRSVVGGDQQPRVLYNGESVDYINAMIEDLGGSIRSFTRPYDRMMTPTWDVLPSKSSGSGWVIEFNKSKVKFVFLSTGLSAESSYSLYVENSKDLPFFNASQHATTTQNFDLLFQGK